MANDSMHFDFVNSWLKLYFTYLKTEISLYSIEIKKKLANKNPKSQHQVLMESFCYEMSLHKYITADQLFTCSIIAWRLMNQLVSHLFTETPIIPQRNYFFATSQQSHVIVRLNENHLQNNFVSIHPRPRLVHSAGFLLQIS